MDFSVNDPRELIPDPTVDQEAIRDAMKSGKSFRMVAHAGTGKTTTLIWSVARQQTTETVLLLEYNRDLRLEAKQIVREAGLTHVTVHNYDSFLLEFYDPLAPSRDFQMALQRVLRQNIMPLRAFKYSVIIVDEAQDMTQEYAALLQKILRDNLKESVQLVLAGDPKQTIYAFRGAKSDYLIHPQSWRWGPKVPQTASELTLAETFRFGDGMCAVVNDLCSGTFKPAEWGDDIVSAFPGGLVELWTMDVGSQAKTPKQLLEVYKDAIAVGTVCVLAQSLREENALLTCFFENASQIGAAPCEDETSGLPIIRTIHTSKGRQYKSVFFFVSQADSWLTDTGRLKKDRNTLLYVACTRATHNLHIVQGSDELVMTRIWNKCARKNVPVLIQRNGISGDAFVSLPPPIDTRYIPAFAHSAIVSLDKHSTIEEKESLIAMLSFDRKEEGPKLLEPTSLEELVVRCRVEWHSVREGAGALAPLLRWAIRSKSKEGARHIYAKLSRRSLCHVFLDSFEADMKAIDPRSTKWREWANIVAFHPERRYGHAAKVEKPPREDLCDRLYGAFIKRCEDLEFISLDKLYSSDLTITCSHEHLFYLDSSRGEVTCPIFCAAEALRPQDIFAVTLAASRLKVGLAHIAYLQQGMTFTMRIGRQAAERAEQLASRANQWSR